MFEFANELMNQPYSPENKEAWKEHEQKLDKKCLDKLIGDMFKKMDNLIQYFQGTPDDLQEYLSAEHPDLYDKWVSRFNNKIADLFFP